MAFPKIIFEMAKKQPGLSIFDAGLLYDGKDFFFSEFCAMRHGFDGMFSQIAMSGDERGLNNAVHHFDAIAQGKSPLVHNYGAAVRLFQSEPHGEHADMYADHYAIDWLNEVSDQLFLYCLQREKIGDEEIHVSNGFEKDVGCCTGTGDTHMAALNNAYRCAEGVAMVGLFYRPKEDLLSKSYFTSIGNRYDFLMESDLLLPQ